MKRAATILGLLALTVALAVCADDREPAPAPAGSVTKLPDPADAIGPELMLALSQAKNFHHKAKVYMADGNVAEAITQVRAILALSFPAGAPEADDVKLDARALLGKLLLGQGKLDEAMAVVDEGLAMTTRDSFYLANLYTVLGELHEARAANLEPGSIPPTDAVRAQITQERRAAISAFDRSIQIDTALQQRLVRP